MALRNAFADIATDDKADELATLLRRIVKLLEASATVDANNRQKVVVESLSGAAVTTVTTVGTLTTVTNAVPVGNVATISLENQRMFQDTSRSAYNTGIRSKLV